MVTNAKTRLGALSEARFLEAAAARGWQVAIPWGHDHTYDFLVNRGAGWETVQVKTGYFDAHRDNWLACISRGGKGNRSAYVYGDFDLLAVVDNDAVWLVPWAVVATATSDKLRYRLPEYEEYRLN